MKQQIDQWLSAAVEAAKLGAAELEKWRSRFSVTEKGRADLVTEADHASQKAIQSFIHSQYPDHHFLGEENPDAKKITSIQSGAPPTWIVDPLDGTANYVHDVPCYCVSIGLWAEGDLVVGIVYDPRQNEMFSASSGKGAFLNGKRINVSATPQLQSSMLSTGFPPDPEYQERNLHWWKVFSYQTQGLRRTGSTALNLAYVSCGRFDGYWAFDNFAWDVAGGIVLVREAGGLVSRTDGTMVDPFKTDILASNSHIFPELIATLNDSKNQQ